MVTLYAGVGCNVLKGTNTPLQVGDGEGAAGRDVKDDLVGDFRFEAENVTDRMLVLSPL